MLCPAVAMTPSEIQEANGWDLHLLSIEGRGICGLTALVTLKEVLRQYQYLRKLPQIPRPCDVFDLAGGTGTGGIIAIMLFRLRMTVDEAIVAYTRLSEDVFSKKTLLQPHKKRKVSQLENAIATVIHSSLDVDKNQAEKIPMLDDEGPKCFVSTSTAKNLSSPTLFRTYLPPRLASYDCTIMEAVRATTAEEPFFPSIDIGDGNAKETFIHGGLRLYNPVKAVLEEAVSIFPGQSISCVLSIGSGVQGVTGFKHASNAELADVLKRVMNDGDRISDEVARELSDKNVFYCRLNVDHGFEDIGFEDWERLGEVKTHTGKYLEKYDVSQKVSQLVKVLNRRTIMESNVEETLRALSEFLDGLVPIPCGECWNTLISEFIRIPKPSTIATETLNVQSALLRDTLKICMQGRDFVALPDELKASIQRLLEGMKKTFQGSPGQEDPMTYVNTNIQKLLQRFWLQNHIAGNIAVHDILKYIQQDDSMKKSFIRLERHAINQNLGNLNVSPFAAYDSSEVSEKVSCFKGTRVRLLNEIASWVASDDPDLAPIYVLDGVAGIGKSTIAKTIAEQAARINVLGASFFFSRNDDKRKTAKTFFPTIAYQLAYYDKGFAEQINGALLSTPHVVTQMPLKQFLTLIVEPLKEAFAVAENPILIVIDAMDECEGDGDALLKIFADSIKNMPRLKLFITTRPEYHIRNVLDRYHHLKRFHLQDIETSVVESDIRLYLEHYLSENQVQDKLPDLGCSWRPVERDMKVLIGLCGTLFILASTAVKFILDSKRSDPEEQLCRLLKGVSRQDFSGSKYMTAMDSFYSQILLSAVPDDDDSEDWFRRYQIVVGTIVALQYPLPCHALSGLVGILPRSVKVTFSHLHSLVPPTGQDLTFRIHHKSFPDFVTSPSRCERRFLIDLKTRHLELGKRCLGIMNSQLKINVCNLGLIDRFKDNYHIKNLTWGCISEEFAYAVTHWATHLTNAAMVDDEAEQLLENFALNHLLAWLEVLSIVERVEIAHLSLDGICKLLDKSKTMTDVTRGIFQDGCRFIGLNIGIIKVAAGHVLSAFAFVPQDTGLYRTYGGLQGSFTVVSGYERLWDPTISVMTGRIVTFSGDGTKLASGSANGSMRLWDGQTGAELAVLRGHTGYINSAMFSPDGARLASGSDDKTVRLWDCQTGAELIVLQGHTDRVHLLAFSPDGTKLVSASKGGTMRLWDGQTGAKFFILQEYSGWTTWVNSVAFSPDSTKLASASNDGTVRLWDGQTGSEIAVLRGHSSSVNSVVFSQDGRKLASGSDDGTVRLWNSQTGAEVTVLRGHSKSVNTVVFLQCHAKLASASSDQTMRVWDAQTGANISVLKGNWFTVVVSPDGTKLASRSDAPTVRLWDSQTGAEITVLHGHSGWLNSVMFSPDSTKLVSASNDETVRLWDVQTPTRTPVFRGTKIHSMVFSPDGTKLAFSSDTLRLWDGQTGAEIALLYGNSACINPLMFSSDGTKFASAYSDGIVRLWDAQTAAEVLRGPRLIGKAYSVAISPDGRKFASVIDGGYVGLWGPTDTKVAVLQGHSDWVIAVSFSPNGTELATASRDRTVRLWNGQTGAEIAVLIGHSDWVCSVVFSPDGNKLASTSFDKTARLWDVQTGATIASCPGLPFAAFTLDSSRLISLYEHHIYQVDTTTGDTLSIPLGLITYPPIEGVQVPNLNLWVIRVDRKQRPLNTGLLVVKFDKDGVLRFRPLCWFPPDLTATSLAVSSLSRIAVGYQNGRVLLLDVDFSSLL